MGFGHPQGRDEPRGKGERGDQPHRSGKTERVGGKAGEQRADGVAEIAPETVDADGRRAPRGMDDIADGEAAAVDFLTAFYFGGDFGPEGSVSRSGGLKKLVTENLGAIDARGVNSIPLFKDDEGRNVVVCPEEARRNNPQNPSAELRLLVAHGVLHLLGYDHEEEQDRREMWTRQERYSGVSAP